MDDGSAPKPDVGPGDGIDDDIREASTLKVSEERGHVGDTLTLKGVNLPRDREVKVVWNSVRGMWGVRRSNKVLGPQYQPRKDRIYTTVTGDSSTFKMDWTVQEDFGGEHALELRTGDDVKLDSTTFTIDPHFELDRTEAPVGDRFRLTGYGLGPDPISTNYQVTWDNGYVGFVTGVQNHGTATAEIRAAGPPGEHVLRVWRNPTGVPFLQNDTQSPYGHITGGRRTTWTVTVTDRDDAPPTAEMEEMWPEDPVETHLPDVEAESDAELSVEPSSGKPGTDAIVTGRAFPAGAAVDLVWHTHGGQQAAGDPVRPEPRPGVLPTVEADEDGSFQVDVEIPSDMGATRPITAEIDGRRVAVAGFMLQPDIVDISPTEGPVGTQIDVELAGLGWPLYENNYYVLYDNKPVGYVASNLADEDGIVRFNVEATGHAGYHFIDVVPSFNDTDADDFEFDHKPHLSYLDNHPVRALPGMHFTFEVTGE